jgi:hypothetical protein
MILARNQIIKFTTTKREISMVIGFNPKLEITRHRIPIEINMYPGIEISGIVDTSKYNVEVLRVFQKRSEQISVTTTCYDFFVVSIAS